ncbi:MAG: phosphoenolpyruvate--protein phosphotransferase [Verrucomicrobiota bacterium]
MSAEETHPKPSREIRYAGIAASPGVATGTIFHYTPDEIAVRKRPIQPENIPDEINRLESALIKTHAQLKDIREQLANSLGEKDAAIFDAHLLVIEDPALLESIRGQLHAKLLCVDYVFYQITRSYAKKMRELDDKYLQERAEDVMDVAKRVLRNLDGKGSEFSWQKLDGNQVVYAHDLAPSDTALMNRGSILGFVTEMGSKTSHSAIMARSLNVPAVVGIEKIDPPPANGMEVLLDGYEGMLILNPSEQTKYEYGRIESQRHELDVLLEDLRETFAVTTDHRHIIVSANVELPEDLGQVEPNGAEGIGLFRSEFLFLNRDDYPSEDEQVAMYRQVAQACHPHNAIIRTLDVGGDKSHPYLGIEREDNPFLGWRGIRYLLTREDVFRRQLRAIGRASVEGNINVMFPMISDISELLRGREILDSVWEELRQEGHEISDRIDVGIMIETPSAALTADLLAKEVDFFSVGTNDLIQYAMAVDRNNQKVAHLYQPTHPAVIRLLKIVTEAAHAEHIWVGVCGEMASDLLLTPMLIGLGVDELSLGSIFIPRVKRVVQSLNYEITQQMVEDLINARSPEENIKVLTDLANNLYPELL